MSALHVLKFERGHVDTSVTPLREPYPGEYSHRTSETPLLGFSQPLEAPAERP